MMNHNEWVEHVAPGESNRDIARAAGVPMRTLYSQRERSALAAENVIAIAVAYGHHPVGALVDTGYLDATWAEQVDPARALRTVTEQQIADEVLRRMNIGVERGGALDTPIDELSARRSKTSRPSVAPVPYDDAGMPADAVAYGHDEVGGSLDDFEQ